MASDQMLNFLVLAKDDGERFVFVFDDESGGALYQTFGRFAGDPRLAFNWYDAAAMTERAQALLAQKTDRD